ncbi:MAG: leucine-rich repeat domain-containing protein [Bifidobacterium sp.]|nr:leucine-rich repeat domain-containing protein [Bifidobacterium sp.]
MVDNASFNSTYPLTYDANGGTGTPSAKADTGYGAVACTSQHASGETVTLPTGATGDCQGIVPTRDGMEFVGWSPTKLAPFDTLSDAKTHVVTTVTMPPTRQTMYAVWARGGETPTSYTVTFKTQMNAAGIAAEVPALATVTVTPGGTLLSSSIPLPPASYNPGIKFMGWGVQTDTIGNGEGKMAWFDVAAPITANETVWTLWGYEDTAAGHKCIMGIDTVATCFPDPTLAQKVVDSPPPLVGGAEPATIVHHVTDVWAQSAALSFGSLNYNSENVTEDTPMNISELDGLQTLTGLGQLHISNVSGHTLNEHSRDLHQLKYLVWLNNLFANGDGITDVSTLSGLTNLSTLYLTDNNISNLSGLSWLSNLVNLNLDNNANASGTIKPDLSTLISNSVGLTGIKTLSLNNNNKLTDISPLGCLTTLSTLKLKDNRIQRIDSLASIHGLYELDLDNNYTIEDISVIKQANFQWLGILGLSSNKVSDISSLHDVTTLQKLWLHKNEISDVSPLAGLTGLNTLYIGNNHIRDISSLSGLTGLNWGTPTSCDVGTSSFCADGQKVTLSEQIADPGVSMPAAVSLKKTGSSVDGVAVDSVSTGSTTPGGRFDADHQQLTWPGPMEYNNDDSPKDLTQEFSKNAELPNTIGLFSGTITEPYTVAKHTVTFDPDGGALPSSQPSSAQVYSGYEATAPTSEPSRDGYRFMGWTCAADVAGVCHEGDAFDFANTAVTKDVTLKAKWQELASALPFTGASYRDDWWRGGLVVIVLCAALASGLLRRRAAGPVGRFVVLF